MFTKKNNSNISGNLQYICNLQAVKTGSDMRRIWSYNLCHSRPIS